MPHSYPSVTNPRDALIRRWRGLPQLGEWRLLKLAHLRVHDDPEESAVTCVKQWVAAACGVPHSVPVSQSKSGIQLRDRAHRII